ncbi:MAG: hypothetical protein NTW86_28990 [Candidatus Sumerlaeota bacterium]|nr:hypothetical protein [Candidatus Sumerlaeota bacterium]
MRQSFLSIFLIPVLLGLALLARLPLERARGALVYPYQLDNEEGYLLDEAVELSHGRNIYTSIRNPPYLVANYPPLFPLCWAALARIGRPSLEYGRMLCVSSLLGLGLALLLIALRAGRQLLCAAVCPLLFVATYECHNWAAYARVDLPALFLTLLGLTSFLAEDTRAARRLATAFFLLGALTKQTTLAAPLACAIFLLLRDWREGLRFLLVFLFWLAGATLLLTALTRGQYWLHTVVYNANTMDWGQLGVWLRHLVRFYRFYLAGMALGLGFLGYRLIVPFKEDDQEIVAGAEEPNPADESAPAEALAPTDQAAPSEQSDSFAASTPSTSPIPSTPSAPAPAPPPPDYTNAERLAVVAIYFALAALSIVSLAKAGAAENYLLEPLAAGAIFYCAVLGRALWESASSRRAWASRLFAALMIAAAVLHVWWLFCDNGAIARMMFSRSVPSAAQEERANELRLAVALANGPVLCEDPIFLILNGRRPPINPFILSQLAREGKWDETPFVRQLGQGEFSMVVTTEDVQNIHGDDINARYTTRMVEALRECYALYAEYRLGRDGQTYYVYRPRPGYSHYLDVAWSGAGFPACDAQSGVRGLDSQTGKPAPLTAASALP